MSDWDWESEQDRTILDAVVRGTEATNLSPLQGGAVWYINPGLKPWAESCNRFAVGFRPDIVGLMGTRGRKHRRLLLSTSMTKTNSKFTRRRLINRLGIAILLIGLAWSSGAYLMEENRMARQSTDQQVVDNVSRDDTLSFEDSKTSSRGTEIYFGKVGVLLSTWFHRWEGLEDFQRSAIVIAMSCILTASICFLVAHRSR